MSQNNELSKIAKNKGLPEFSTNQLIELIKIEMLYVSYKDLDGIMVPPPVKPKELKMPVEPIEPLKPVMPTLVTLSGDSEQIAAINVEIYQTYLKEKEVYPQELKKYEKDLEKFKNNQSVYQMEIKSFDKNQENYEKEIAIYNRKKIEYDRFLLQKDLNNRIEKTYNEWTGNVWNKNFKSKMTYFMLIGPPGHGKSTVFRQSAKMVSSALGLVYKENPTVNEIVDMNCFVLYVNNLAGEVSKTGTAGLPAKVKDEQGNEYTGLLPSYAMSSLTKAAAGMLLLDDIANASSFIQNIALPLTNENSFNELKLDNIYVGMTSNLGALDGTNIAKVSSALRNRVKAAFTMDIVDDFIYRVRNNEEFNDEIGDFFVSDYLENYKDDQMKLKEIFYSLPSNSELGGFSNPRSLEALIREMRRLTYDHNGFNDENKKLIRLISQSLMGNSAGEDFYQYIESVYTDVVPMIDGFFNKNKFNMEKFNEKTENIFDTETSLFQYKFRKYLEKKIRSEATFISVMTNSKLKEKRTEELTDKIATMFVNVTQSIREVLAANLRENIFVGIEGFSEKHAIHNSGECINTNIMNSIVEKITKKCENNTADEAFVRTIKSIAAKQSENKKEKIKRVRPKN